MVKEKIYRDNEVDNNKDNVKEFEEESKKKELLIEVSKSLLNVPINKFIPEEKLVALVGKNDSLTAILNTIASIDVICILGNYLGIPILRNEINDIGKRIVITNKTMDDFSSPSEYMVYLIDEVKVENFIVNNEIEEEIYGAIGGILLLNIISQKVKTAVAPNFINILKNIGVRPDEILGIIKAFAKKELAANLDPLFNGTLIHNDRIKTIETLKNSLMTTFLKMSEIGAYDKIDEMREENRLFKKELGIK